jgi:hypothetical protein
MYKTPLLEDLYKIVARDFVVGSVEGLDGSIARVHVRGRHFQWLCRRILRRRSPRASSAHTGERAHGTAWWDGDIDIFWATGNHALREVRNLDALCDVVVA